MSASHCVGFTFPGMMDEPGSLDGSFSSIRPDLGPDANNRISFAIFCSVVATELRAWDACSMGRCALMPENLFLAGLKGNLSCVDSSSHTVWSKLCGALRPVPIAVPPMGSSNRWSSD